MKIATWNVNSLKVRLPQVLNWLVSNDCDILALQELKLANEHNLTILDQFAELGYYYAYNGQKTYNGVALVSKYPLSEISYDIPEYQDIQKRVISATVNNVRIICAYVVNGESLTSDKYTYKLDWLNHFNTYVAKQLKIYPNLIVLGDFNIAPNICDTYNPQLWEGNILCSNPERDAFKQLLDFGLVDSLAYFNPDKSIFTWWDYRNFAFRRKQGLRIDHILVTPQLIQQTKSCYVDTKPRQLERPSDHAPVVLEFVKG